MSEQTEREPAWTEDSPEVARWKALYREQWNRAHDLQERLDESTPVYRGWRGYGDGSRSEVERWVRATNGDWVSLDSERRTDGDIILEHFSCAPAASGGRTEPEGETSGKRHDGTVSARWVGLNCPVCGSGEERDCICPQAEAIAKAEWEHGGRAVYEAPWEQVSDLKRRHLILKALPAAHEAVGRTEPAPEAGGA